MRTKFAPQPATSSSRAGVTAPREYSRPERLTPRRRRLSRFPSARRRCMAGVWPGIGAHVFERARAAGQAVPQLLKVRLHLVEELEVVGPEAEFEVALAVPL